jgi:hypothetical protein
MIRYMINPKPTAPPTAPPIIAGVLFDFGEGEDDPDPESVGFGVPLEESVF